MERHEAFTKLLDRRPYNKHRKRLGFISYKELAKAYEKVAELREILKRLEVEIEGWIYSVALRYIINICTRIGQTRIFKA